MDRIEAQRRLGSLEQEAYLWRPQWMELKRFIRPTRGFFDDMPNIGRAPDYRDMIDGTPSRAVRILAAGMTSGLTSPSRPWFKLGLADSDLAQYEPVREWLDTVQNRMFDVFARSNIYGVLHSMHEELGTFGTACALALDDFETILRGRVFTSGEYYLATGKDGSVNEFARESWFSVGQLIEQFGFDQVSPSVQALYKNQQLHRWVKVAHLISANEDRQPGRLDNRNMAFRQYYWEVGSQYHEFLKVDGYEEFPGLCPRWDLTTSGDYYGKGPGWEALGDVRMLQRMQRDKLLIIEKLGDPPVQADASVTTVNTLPGGVTRSTATTRDAGVRPAYEITPDVNHLQGAIQETQKAVEAWFYTDLFLMLAQNDGGQMTAREVAELHEEKLLMLGPVIERLEGELTDPLIDRTFGLMLRRGIVPPPPLELQGVDLKVEYISILAQAQKMVGTAAIQQSAAFIGNLAGAVPEVLDVYNFDEMATQYGEQMGLPPKIIRSPDEIQAIRQKRAQAQAAAQQQQQSMAAAQGAKVLADTRLGQNSALDAILGTNGGGTGGGGPGQ